MEKQKWGWWSVFWKAFRDASPVIFFFLFLFSVVYILFGMQYGMIVSVVTIFFQTCYKNNNQLNPFLQTQSFYELVLNFLS